MEGYDILSKLGKGAQGNVFLVQSKNDKKKYVIKKIECKDESEATTAFKEVMALKNLQHSYICGYKEFFVEWDKEQNAIMVCIVMDHYECGDLQNLMEVKRKEKQKFDELVIKKWLGQIMEVMHFIHHDKKVIHRDLKPSNLFIKNNALDLVVGDFGVATVMGDVRTQTRTSVGTLVWMAPEVLTKPYDERSDIWSIGCIFLQLLTCHLFDEKIANEKVGKIKNNPKDLEDLLQVIGKEYSDDLVAVIRQMMRHNHQQRPTTEDLLKLSYVDKCVSLTSSSRIARAKKQEVTTKERPLPSAKGLPAVIAYLKEEKQNENCVTEALEWIAGQADLKLDNAAEKLVAAVMVEHMVARSVCLHGTKIFAILASHAKADDAMFTSEVVKTIISAAKSHSHCSEIQTNVIDFIIRLSTYESAPTILGKHGAVQCILETMRTFPKLEELNANSCQALLSLCTDEANARIGISEGGIETICNCMRNHDGSPLVLEQAVSATVSLLIEDDAFDRADELNLVYLLMTAMKSFLGHTGLVKFTLMAFTSLFEEERMALLFIECEGGNPKVVIQGIPLLKRVYEVHNDNVDLVRGICETLESFLQHDDLVQSIDVADVNATLSAVSKKYATNQEVKQSCESALRHLSI